MNIAMTHRVLLSTICLVALAGCNGSGSSHSPHAETAQSKDAAPNKEDERHIQLSERQLQSAGIALERAGPASIRETLPVYGVIAPNAERVRDVGARFPGVILSVSKAAGQEVRLGEPLATIESNESLQTYTVVAPLSGTVIARNANPGEQSGEKVLFTVADLSTVWVELSLFPKDMTRIAVGQAVDVRTSDDGMSAEGKIAYVAPFSTSANQTLTARVLLPNAQRRWAPGLYVTAEITLSKSEVPVAVRSDALQTWKGTTVVFVRNEDRITPQPVTTGRTDPQFTEIEAGLASGATYAAANSFILKAELGKGSAAHDH